MKTDPLRQQTILDITERLMDIGTPSGSLENCPDMKERVVRLIAPPPPGRAAARPSR